MVLRLLRPANQHATKPVQPAVGTLPYPVARALAVRVFTAALPHCVTGCAVYSRIHCKLRQGLAQRRPFVAVTPGSQERNER